MTGARAPGCWEQRLLRMLMLACLLSAGAWCEANSTKWLADADIWVHLSTGDWILRNHTVPHTALFTQHSELEWAAASWGFDAVLAYGVKTFGLRAIPLLGMIFITMLAVAAFQLAQGWRGRTWLAAGLSAAAVYELSEGAPGPWMTSAILFAIELDILMRCRNSKNSRAMRWLPVLFLFWANLDSQFLYGLLILGLYTGVLVIETGGWRLKNGNWPEEAGLRASAFYSVLSVAATVISPYALAPYKALGHSAIGPLGETVLDSLHAMSFRLPQHYALLLLTSLACFALGKRRSRDGFKICALGVCVALAFRWNQDIWIGTLMAVAVIADGTYRGEFVGEATGGAGSFRYGEGLIAGAVAAVLIMLASTRIPPEQALRSAVAREFPVKAAEYIREARLSPPLYNAYAWGGFLTWYLPEYPVAIDGRMEMYGRAINESFFETSTGLRPAEQDWEIGQAQTFLLKKESRLRDAVSQLEGVETVYEDELAVVMKRNAPMPARSGGMRGVKPESQASGTKMEASSSR